MVRGFVTIKAKNVVPWTYFIRDLNAEKTVRMLYQNELQKTNEIEVGVEKVIRRKGNKLHVTWKGLKNSVNKGIDIKIHNTNE